MKHLFVTDFSFLGECSELAWMAVRSCMGRGLGPLVVSTVRWEKVPAHQSAWSPGHQQAGSKVPHLWPQGSPNIRSSWFDSWAGKICWRRDRLSFPIFLGFPCGLAGEESTCNMGDMGSILDWEDPLEKGKATHSSILAWRIPWTV